MSSQTWKDAEARSARNHNNLSIVLGFVGLYIAGSLTAAHYLHGLLPCGASNGCEKVAADPSSEWMGVPVSAFGLVGYAILTLLAVLRSMGVAVRRSTQLGFFTSLIGLVVSVGLTRHSVVDIGALCTWCLASAATMAVLFVCHMALLRRKVESLAPGKMTALLPALSLVLVILGLFATTRTLTKPTPVSIDLAALRAIPQADLVASDDRVMGFPTASITLVEFADLSCESCKEMHAKLVELVQRYPSVRLVFHHLPLTFLPGHQLSEQLAVISEGSKSDQEFWTFVSNIYGSTKDHPFEANAIHDKALLAKATAKVQRDIALAKRLKIDETPTYIILTKDGSRTPARVNELFSKLQALLTPGGS